MNSIVKYQLATWLKNAVAGLPEQGIDSVPDYEVKYVSETNLTARIRVTRISTGLQQLFDFKLQEVG